MTTKTSSKPASGNYKADLKAVRSKPRQPKTAITERSLQDKFLEYLPLAVIVLAFFMIYSQALNFDLLDWDDYGYIKNNPDVQNFSIRNFFTSFYGGNYHPLTCITWSVDYYLGGLNGKSYHMTNMLLHVLNIVLMYFFVKFLFERKDIALFTAALFAIHPMHVESVAWVSERKDVLYACFFLLSLIAYLRFIRNDHKKYYLASLVLFILSLLSKSAAVVLPLVLLLIDYFKEKKITTESLLLKLPFFLISILFGVIALKSQQTSMSYGFAPHFPLISRLLIASYGMTHYLLSFVFPFKQSALHPYPVAVGEALPWYFFGSAITIFLIIFCIIYFKKYRKILLFAFGFFFINLLLVIQILPVGKAIVAERYTYLAYPGLAMLLGYLLFGFSGRSKNIILVSIAAWLIFLSVQTYARLPVWKNSLTIFSDIISTHPEEESGWYNRGLVRFYMKDYKAALEDYNASLALKADNAPALYNRSLVRKEFQDYQGVLDDLNKAIALEPGYIDARKNRGIANAIFKDYQGALNDFSMVLKQYPDDTSTLINRGLIWTTLDKKEKACEDFTKAARLGSSRASKFASEACLQKKTE